MTNVEIGFIKRGLELGYTQEEIYKLALFDHPTMNTGNLSTPQIKTPQIPLLKPVKTPIVNSKDITTPHVPSTNVITPKVPGVNIPTTSNYQNTIHKMQLGMNNPRPSISTLPDILGNKNNTSSAVSAMHNLKEQQSNPLPAIQNVPTVIQPKLI